jgi:phosphatidylcholine synthase
MRFRRQRLAAWGVHLYTASGGMLGMAALLAAADGRYREAFLLLVVTMLIDATDGLMARRLNVRSVLPRFDGAMMDNVIDILNFAWTPIFIIARIGVLPHPAWVVVPILGALYAYGQSDMKTDEGYFIGFPTYWSIVALYLFWLRPDPITSLALVVIPGILSFVPTRYLYPSKGSALWRSNWVFGTLWFMLVIYLLAQEHPNQLLVLFSLVYPAYYMSASFWVDYRVRRGLMV